nr:MAG TPA: hypothetical protein [Caudoviricetes sp.]
MWGGSGILRVTVPFGKKPCTGRTGCKQRQGIFYTTASQEIHISFVVLSA